MKVLEINMQEEPGQLYLAHFGLSMCHWPLRPLCRASSVYSVANNLDPILVTSWQM